MTLERHTDGGGNESIRLVACPFCGAGLRSRDPPRHLRRCAAFFEAMDVDPDDPLEGQRATARDDPTAAV